MSSRPLHDGSAEIVGTNQFIQRICVNRIFEQAENKSLITVTAGAGFGKTAAVSNYLFDSSKQTIWLQLTLIDNLVTKFWDHFTQAASYYNEELGNKLSTLEFPDSLSALDSFIQTVSDEGSASGRLYIVLDDVHIIYDTSILWFIENLVSISMKNITVVLISRTDINIRVSSLKSKGRMSSIKEDNLRFTLKETEEYYAIQGINFTKEALKKIQTATEGWIFAIYLIGLTAGNHNAYKIEHLEAIKADIYKFIETEIFSLFPDTVQKSLVRISLLENSPIGLIRELFESNAIFFAEWDNINSFMRYDNFTSSCQIHNLFKEFLYERQQQLSDTEKNEVYLCAANWYNQNDMPVDAILNYEKVGCYKEILEIIRSHYCSSSKETAQFILDIIDRAPSELFEQNKMVRVYRAKFLINNFMVEQARNECIKLKNEYEKLPPSEESNIILGEIYINLGLLKLYECLGDNKFDFAEYFIKADKYLPNGSYFADNTYHLNVGVYACPVSPECENGLSLFKEEFIKAYPYLTKVLNGCGTGDDELISTEICFYKRDFTNAIRHANQCLGIARQQDQYDLEFIGSLYLIRIYMALGHFEKIDEILAQIDNLNKKYNTSLSNRHMDIVCGWYYSHIGQLDLISGWILNAEEGTKVMSIDFGFNKIVHARALLKSKKYSEMLGLLATRQKWDSLHMYLIGSIEVKAMEAVALYCLDKKQEAFELLTDAYHMAEPEELIMPFVELGKNMRTLAQAALKEKSCNIPSVWLEKISIKSSAYAKSLSRITSEYISVNQVHRQDVPALTEKETEILLDLCNGLTREEIAENQNITINTVKSRMQNIYQKLGAINSFDAVRIASKHRLIP